MKNTMEYKGYIGSVEFSEKDNLFLGKLWESVLCYPMKARLHKNWLQTFMKL